MAREAAALPGAAEIGWCLVFSITASLLMLTVPLYMMHVYDGVITTGSLETLIALTAMAVGLIAVFGLLDAMRGKILARAAVRLERGLARRLAQRSLERALKPGSEDATLNDLATVRKFFSGPSVTAFFDAPLMPAFLLVAVLLHPLFGAVAAVAAGLLAALALATDFLTRRPLSGAGENGARARHWFENGLRRSECADAFGMSGRILDRWEDGFHAKQGDQLRASETAGALVAASRALRLVAQVAILGTGAALVLDGAVTPGAMIGATFIIARALAPMESAIAGWRQARGALLSWRRVKSSLALPPRRKGGMALPAPKGRIDVEEARFTPEGAERPAIDGLSFSVAPGRIVAVIGPSGSGKSTLARLLAGIEAPEHGHVRLDGSEVFAWDREALAPHIGYLPQGVDLLGATVADAIARMGPVDPEAVVDAARRAGAHDMILRLPGGYDTPLIDGGRNLSGGQRQWIGLARALYGRPRFVVLDEPDASLDGRGARALLNALDTLAGEGATVVLLGHGLRFAGRADLVLVLDEGRQTAFGTRERVFGTKSGPREAPARPRPTAQPAA